MDYLQMIVIATVDRLQSQEDRLKELIGMSGALPGEVGIVTRLNQLPGRDLVGSMRTDLN